MIFFSTALAISGTSVVGEGQLNVYLGVDAQRLERLQIQGPDGADAEVIDVGEGLSTVRGKVIATLGLANRVDFEVGVPYEHNQANRGDSAVCDALGLNACGTSSGLGVITGRAKWLMLDEYSGTPVSLAVSAEGRIGQFTAADRAQITARGEGTQDLGGVLALSRLGALRDGYWVAATEVGWRYRFPNTRSYPNFTGDGVAPNSEFTGRAEVVIAPWQAFGFGPVADVFWRPGGLDFKEADLTDIDRLAALRVASVRVGGTINVRTKKNLSGSLSVTHTVFSMNNPYVTTVSAGFSVQRPLWGRSGS